MKKIYNNINSMEIFKKYFVYNKCGKEIILEQIKRGP